MCATFEKNVAHAFHLKVQVSQFFVARHTLSCIMLVRRSVEASQYRKDPQTDQGEIRNEFELNDTHNVELSLAA